MATVDFTGVQGDMMKLQALQAAIATTTDPTTKAVLSAEAQGLQASVTAELAHAQAQADATGNMFQQMEMTSMLGGVFSSLGNALPAVINLIK